MAGTFGYGFQEFNESSSSKICIKLDRIIKTNHIRNLEIDQWQKKIGKGLFIISGKNRVCFLHGWWGERCGAAPFLLSSHFDQLGQFSQSMADHHNQKLCFQKGTLDLGWKLKTCGDFFSLIVGNWVGNKGQNL